MKKILIAMIVALPWLVSAQEYKFAPKNVNDDTKVVIKNFFADISVEGISGSQIIIEALDYEGVPERAKGLKPLSATGPENTGIGLNLTQSGNEILITAASRSADKGEYRLKIPKNFKVQIDYNSWQAGDLYIKGLSNEVEVSSQVGDLVLEDITGPLVAHTLSSDIVVTFSALNQKSPTSISSTSGDIDVTMPSDTKGMFKMSSISGEVYTDLDFQFENDKNLRRLGGGMTADANLNGGGVEVALRCVSGNIYIRKR
ncbi:MAG: DUF4097 family beta strand repeat-containing protein [Cyclobacteriaceae bacterium]